MRPSFRQSTVFCSCSVLSAIKAIPLQLSNSLLISSRGTWPEGSRLCATVPLNNTASWGMIERLCRSFCLGTLAISMPS